MSILFSLDMYQAGTTADRPLPIEGGRRGVEDRFNQLFLDAWHRRAADDILYKTSKHM